MVFPVDYVINKQEASTIVNVDGVTPIAGGGSLHTQVNDVVAVTDKVAVQNNTYSNGILTGRIRAKIRIDSMTLEGDGYVGFSAMQNSPTIDGVSDKGYGVVVTAETGLTGQFVRVVKWTTGFNPTPADLAAVAPPTIVFGQTFVFQMDWISSIPLVGGTLLKGYIGVNTTDFNNLVEVVSVTDTVSPLLVSSTEGLIHSSVNPTTVPDFDVRWDDLSIFTLV